MLFCVSFVNLIANKYGFVALVALTSFVGYSEGRAEDFMVVIKNGAH